MNKLLPHDNSKGDSSIEDLNDKSWPRNHTINFSVRVRNDYENTWSPTLTLARPTNRPKNLLSVGTKTRDTQSDKSQHHRNFIICKSKDLSSISRNPSASALAILFPLEILESGPFNRDSNLQTRQLVQIRVGTAHPHEDAHISPRFCNISFRRPVCVTFLFTSG